MGNQDYVGLIKIGIIGAIALYALPKIFQVLGVEGATNAGETGIAPYTAEDVLKAGGTITTQSSDGLPWWTWISPFTMLAGGYQYATSGNKTTIAPPKTETAPIPLGSSKPISMEAAVNKITKNYLRSSPSQQRITEQIVSDLSKTKTVSGTSTLQPMTVARLTAVAKYGYGGR